MIDPVTILATICAVISASRSLYQWWHEYRENRFTAKSGQPAAVDNHPFDQLLELWKQYNQIASVLGRKFQILLSDSSTNVLLLKQLQQLRPQLVTVQSGIRELEAYRTTLGKDEQTQAQTFKKLTGLAKSINNMQKGTRKALAKIYRDQMPEDDKVTSIENEQLEKKEPPRQFCDGAKLFQSGDKDEDFLSDLVKVSKFTSDWGYICNACGLEVGYYRAVRISSTGQALDTSLLLTASHLNACKWRERRAFYRCLACYKNRKIVDYPSAVAFEKHMEEHPDFTMMNEKDENQVVGLLTQKEEEFLRGVQPAVEETEGTTLDEVYGKESTQALEIEPRHQAMNNQDDVSPVDEKDSIESLFGAGFHSSEDSRPSGKNSFGTFSPSPGRELPAQTNTLRPQGERSNHIPGGFPATPGSASPARLESDSTSMYERDGISTNELDSNAIQELDGSGRHSRPSGEIGPSTPAPGINTTETAILPLGLVNRTADSRAELQSPDPLARPTHLIPRRRVVTQRLGSTAGAEPSHAAKPPGRPAPLIPSANETSGANGFDSLAASTVKQSRAPTSSNTSAGERSPDIWMLTNGVYEYYSRGKLTKRQEEAPHDCWVYSNEGWEGQDGKAWRRWNSERRCFEYLGQ